MLDAAESNGSDYAWSTAIHFWMNISEVMVAYAVLRKAGPRAEFKGHGAKHDKTFCLTYQKPHYFCRVTAVENNRPVARAVKIFPDAVTRLAVIFFEQMILAYPNLPPKELSDLACATHAESLSPSSP